MLERAESGHEVEARVTEGQGLRLADRELAIWHRFAAMGNRAVGKVNAGDCRAALPCGKQLVPAATGDIEHAGPDIYSNALSGASVVSGHRGGRARIAVVLGVVESLDRFGSGRGILFHARGGLRGRRRGLRPACAMVAYERAK